MIRVLVASIALIAGNVAVLAQGADIEGLQEVETKAPPEFRGTLPDKIDLSDTMPAPRAQANTSTCVSWAVTYAAGSQAMRRLGVGPVILSSAFSYNQVSGDRYCRSGTKISKTLVLLRDTGALPVERFSFDAGWCGRLPTEAERQAAAKYRIKGWHAFDAKDIAAVKAQLARGAPVIFAMRVGGKMRAHRGDGIFQGDDSVLSGHAMVAVGYDEARQAFRIQNSWGRGWGDGGRGWFSYDFWRSKVKAGFVID
jgi:hypothetical protein